MSLPAGAGVFQEFSSSEEESGFFQKREKMDFSTFNELKSCGF